jgi:glycosyltransferase involved in cell wall biosynthesis
MRILRIADIVNNRTGGMSRTMYLTGDEMIRLGHEVDYAFTETLQTSGPAKLRRFTVPMALPRLVSAGGRRYDLIEVHEPLGAYYCWKRVHGADLPPIVVLSYGLEERGHQADMAYRRLKGLPVSLRFRTLPLTRLMQSKYAVRHADHVICSNQEDVDHLKAAGVPAERLTRHFSGVTEQFLRDTEGFAALDRRGVLFVGTWILRKGTMEIVKAVSDLFAADPAATFTAAGVGVDPSVVLNSFPESLRPRVRVLQSVNDQGLLDLLRSHHIFLLPSFYEGQPLVMIEAAAAAMASITTDICGMRDFIRDGVNGRLVRVGDGAQIARVLQDLWRHPAECRRLGLAARQTAESHTWSASAKQLLAAYERTVASTARP